jgi:hypothetical protein
MAWTQPTLGWGVLDWMASYLPSPRDPLQPLILTDEQAEYILAWYAVDKAGRFIYRRSISERAKGWGKSPLHGAIALAELGAANPHDSAPVRFDGWRGKEPVGRPWGVKGDPSPWVQIAAVSEDQTDNTYSALYEMLVANDHKAAKALGIETVAVYSEADAGALHVALAGQSVAIGPAAGLGGYYLLADFPAALGAIMLFASGGLLYLIFQDIAPQSRLNRHWAPPLGAVIGFSVALFGDMVMRGG